MILMQLVEPVQASYYSFDSMNLNLFLTRCLLSREFSRRSYEGRAIMMTTFCIWGNSTQRMRKNITRATRSKRGGNGIVKK